MTNANFFSRDPLLFPIVANHLWQSTIFALCIAGLTLLFRKERAAVRFGLWLTASLKFLVPFALMIRLGSFLASSHAAPQAPTAFYQIVVQTAQPFTRTATLQPSSFAWLYALLPVAVMLTWAVGSILVVGLWLVRWRRMHKLIRAAEPVQRSREAELLLNLKGLYRINRPLPVLRTTGSMEPGIVGILRPALIWPVGFSERLSDAELQSILAHELCHVRRRDNLAATLHMLVESLFWFHPMLWWIGGRLMEERERACDEDVLRNGSAPGLYAESILKACRFCIGSPLACVSGVTSFKRKHASPQSTSLERRILHIMTNQSAQQISVRKRLLLAFIGVAALGTPLTLGLLHPATLNALTPDQSSAPLAFDSVSIKPNQSSDKMERIQMTPGGVSYNNITVKKLIGMAYGVLDYQVTGAPEWMETDRFDIEARSTKIAPFHVEADKPMMKLPSGPNPQPAMLRALLADRFNLRLQEQSQVLPVYELTVANSGIKFAKTPAPPVAPDGEQIISVRTMILHDHDEVGVSGPVDAFAGQLGDRLGQKVEDKTGLVGSYEINLHWGAVSGQTETIPAAIEQQLGLRLDPQQKALKTLAILDVQKPTEN